MPSSFSLPQAGSSQALDTFQGKLTEMGYTYNVTTKVLNSFTKQYIFYNIYLKNLKACIHFFIVLLSCWVKITSKTVIFMHSKLNPQSKVEKHEVV